MKLEQMTDDAWRSIAERAHRIAVANGLYDQAPPFKDFCLLAIRSMTDAVEADRKGWRAVDDEWIDNCEDNLDVHAGFNHHIKGTVEDGLADFVIRCVDHIGWNSTFWAWGDIEISFDPIRPDEWEEGEGITDMAYHAIHRVFASVPYALELVLSYCQFAGIDIMRYVDIKLRYNEILLLWRRKK